MTKVPRDQIHFPSTRLGVLPGTLIASFLLLRTDRKKTTTDGRTNLPVTCNLTGSYQRRTIPEGCRAHKVGTHMTRTNSKDVTEELKLPGTRIFVPQSNRFTQLQVISAKRQTG
jgi:hypothetical protein